MSFRHHRGSLSGNMMEKRFKAAGQSMIGMVHFLLMFFIAQYINFMAAMSLGNDPLVLVTFRSEKFKDSMALVV